MKIDGMLIDLEDHLNNYNNVKEVVLARLVKDGVITQEQATEYTEKWNVMLIKPSWFQSWKKRFSNDNSDYLIKYIRFED